MAAKPEVIPQWAKERACNLTNEQAKRVIWYVSDVGQPGYHAITVLARYIAKHEQPPPKEARGEG